MTKEEISAKAKAYNHKSSWSFAELTKSGELQRILQFKEISDLDYEVMNFFYDGMLECILRDARERSERYGFGDGYDWGKRYLLHYVGSCCLVSKSEHPALHSSEAYDMVIDMLASECCAGDDARQERRVLPPRKSTM